MKRSPVFCLIVVSLLLSAFSVSKANETCLVNGVITSSNYVGVSGIRILAMDKSLTGDITLGETTSDSRGNYQVSFSLPAGADQLNLQVQAYDQRQNLVASSTVFYNASNRELINLQIGVINTDIQADENNLIEESESTSVLLPAPTPKQVTDRTDVSWQKSFQIGYGAIVGHLDGLSVVCWAHSIGGQLIMSGAGESVADIKARLHLKIIDLPFGRLSVAPQVGGQLNLASGAGSSVSNTNYGLIGVAEFILQDMLLSELINGQALGISVEIGLFGQGILHIVLDPNLLTPGFSMAGHIYL
ncbi:MAG: hypothetical protein ABIE84_01805 [bacterium]